MANNWEEFGRLAKFDFVINGNAIMNEQTPQLYANSRNRIEIIIIVEIEDKNGKILNVTYEELQKQVFLLNSVTEARVSAPWAISDEANEYTAVVTDRDTLPDTGSTRHVYKYISCSEIDFPQVIGNWCVGINIPGVGEFNTTQSGTTTKNGPHGETGSTFRFPKSLAMTALHSIDYGNRDFVSITAAGFDILHENLEWESQWHRMDIYRKHYNGKCKRRVVSIRPNKNKTGQDNFKKHEVLHYEPIHNNQIYTDSIGWMTDLTHRRDMDCFDLLYYTTTPCAVIGHGTNEDYQVNIWYPRPVDVGFNGNFFIEDSVYYYRFHVNIRDQYNPGEEDGAAKLLLYKFSCPENNTTQYKWNDVIRDVTIKVIDYFGNEGKIQLGFDDHEYFDIPFQK